VAETDRAVDPEPSAVQATVTEHVSHPLETGSVRRLPALELHDPDMILPRAPACPPPSRTTADSPELCRVVEVHLGR
jgi:hypothetical protein